MKFSLIIPTLGRKKEIFELLLSIENIKYEDFEVIIVDQNRDGLIDDVCLEFSGKFQLIHKKVDFKGAARARNYGFGLAKGDIINFPDDDSQLSENILILVEEYFTINSDLDVLFGRTVDKTTNKSSVINFLDNPMKVNQKNLNQTTVECTMFIKRDVFHLINGFDDSFGVGTYYGSEEGADLFLRLLYENKNCFYYPEIIFYHPDKVDLSDSNYQSSIERAFNYGKGFGRLVAKHALMFNNKLYLLKFLKFQLKSSIGYLLYLFINNKKSEYFLSAIKGRNIGLKKSWIEYKK